jgi:CheY-like chemotaxis protein
MRKVLVVDDDPFIRELLQDILADEGYSVAVARDGAEALEILAREHNFLVLLDLMMPRIDGPGVIRALERQPDIRDHNRVVVMSAAERLFAFSSTMQSDIIAEQLAKPFELETMLDLVSRLVPPPPAAS